MDHPYAAIPRGLAIAWKAAGETGSAKISYSAKGGHQRILKPPVIIPYPAQPAWPLKRPDLAEMALRLAYLMKASDQNGAVVIGRQGERSRLFLIRVSIVWAAGSFSVFRGCQVPGCGSEGGELAGVRPFVQFSSRYQHPGTEKKVIDTRVALALSNVGPDSGGIQRGQLFCCAKVLGTVASQQDQSGLV